MLTTNTAIIILRLSGGTILGEEEIAILFDNSNQHRHGVW
jgi:hypothetical protein